MSIADIIKQRRIELNLTLKEVAIKVGVAEATVQRWESGNIKNLRQDKISKLAEALKCSPQHLMGWYDEEHYKHIKDPKLLEYLDMLQKRPELAMIFDLAETATIEDVKKAVKIIEALQNDL